MARTDVTDGMDYGVGTDTLTGKVRGDCYTPRGPGILPAGMIACFAAASSYPSRLQTRPILRAFPCLKGFAPQESEAQRAQKLSLLMCYCVYI